MKRLKKILLMLTVILLVPLMYMTFGERRKAPEMDWGVSFSRSYAESLGLDWRQTYTAILDSLGADHLRIGAYWSDIEQTKGKYDFSDLDYMVGEAGRRGAHVVITLGLRQPRWPECHVPQWAAEMPYEQQEPEIQNLMRTTVERYSSSPAVEAWQVENEYFVKWFGQCPEGKPEFLTSEIALVKSLDPRPVIVTDSGELSLWFSSMGYGDIFGTTVYRKVRGPFGSAIWPYPPVWYGRHARLAQILLGIPKKDIIIAELQMEPWGKRGLVNDSEADYAETFDIDQFRKNAAYARSTGMDTAYLWGAEWWYYMKVKRGNENYWRMAGELWEK